MNMQMTKEVCGECYKCYWYWLNNDTGNECFGYKMTCIDLKKRK